MHADKGVFENCSISPTHNKFTINPYFVYKTFTFDELGGALDYPLFKPGVKLANLLFGPLARRDVTVNREPIGLEFGHFGTVIPAIFRPAGPRKQSPGFSRL